LKAEDFDMDTALQVLLIGGLLFVMMRWGCGSHLFGHGSKHKKDAHAGGHGGCCGGGGKHAKADSGKGNLASTPPAKDVDPVCGKTVSTDTAKTSAHRGLVYFFCSQECREEFEMAPDSYLVEEAGTDARFSPILDPPSRGDSNHA
jgi:YHS domain-containing protein